MEGSVIANGVFDGSARDGRRHTGFVELAESLLTVPSEYLTCNIMLGTGGNVQL